MLQLTIVCFLFFSHSDLYAHCGCCLVLTLQASDARYWCFIITSPHKLEADASSSFIDSRDKIKDSKELWTKVNHMLKFQRKSFSDIAGCGGAKFFRPCRERSFPHWGAMQRNCQIVGRSYKYKKLTVISSHLFMNFGCYCTTVRVFNFLCVT